MMFKPFILYIARNGGLNIMVKFFLFHNQIGTCVTNYFSYARLHHIYIPLQSKFSIEIYENVTSVATIIYLSIYLFLFIFCINRWCQ